MEETKAEGVESESINMSEEATRLTCDVLCSLGSSVKETNKKDDEASRKKKLEAKALKASAKQFQLPMFLTKTYHMINKCDSGIACWSEAGDNFIVKNVEKFSGTILPQYFKHSNFSSFARQLNFYGFRKLRCDPILISTSDEDPTCNYIRFFHQHFQRSRPELLENIKRATKTEQQTSKDDLEGIRLEVSKLKDELATANRTIAELSYDCNRRMAIMQSEYEKLAFLVQQSMGVVVTPTNSSASSVSQGHPSYQAHPHAYPQAHPQAVPPAQAVGVPDALQSLSEAAMTLKPAGKQEQGDKEHRGPDNTKDNKKARLN